ncbi:F5/8 type C domain-containing protein [Dysgonomonas alginatilytica]|uniref:F5/8 type C domain-containing protein n=1 Tax=Dysgonomonas alginatilytica TaxID=1605892 RepID=A0A2V3PQ49_9BACT|nr:family 43 glycosylhydrolase [Dysgonomonas alginatilytica]PXV63555.1 F5/8 type C domain-containing protein [Dysgonomonas alginatilytica]
MKIFKYTLLLMLCILGLNTHAQQNTYCNPINIDYGYCPIPNFTEWGKHRTSADPAIVNYKGDYYLFSTNQSGYWWSSDMLNWNFVSRPFLTQEAVEQTANKWDDLCAPAAWTMGDTLVVFGSTYSRIFPIWISTDPKNNKWEKAVEHFDIGGWDPAFFTDDDGKLYMYNGSSNVYPLYGIELDRKTFQPIGTRKEMLLLDDQKIGWHRFGEHMDNTFLKPFMEGAWMTKHDGKYYLQWGGPGTEFSHYADGYAVSDSPLGFFEHASLPLSMKAGGFIRGAGHGATFQDRWNNYWHTSTMVINVKNNFERRIGIWPAGFDSEGNMYCNTTFGDYPHYIPTGEADHLKSQFTGWMLLNYNKPVLVSSTLSTHYANNIVDENIKTYWSAKTADRGEWLISDLGEVSTVYAVQLNYADQDAEFMGKTLGKFHQYKVYSSLDGKKWDVLIDKSSNKTDVPHDYVQLEKPVKARYLKLENIHMPTGKFAISGFRAFGFGAGEKPNAVEQFMVLRTETDKRSAWLKWKPVENAYAYNIYIGIEPDKLYSSVMVHNVNEYYYAGMDRTKPYYFAIEAINENSTSTWTRGEAK